MLPGVVPGDDATASCVVSTDFVSTRSGVAGALKLIAAGVPASNNSWRAGCIVTAPNVAFVGRDNPGCMELELPAHGGGRPCDIGVRVVSEWRGPEAEGPCGSQLAWSQNCPRLAGGTVTLEVVWN